MTRSNITATALFWAFVGLLANIGGAATTLAAIAPFLGPLIPLIGFSGIFTCSLWLLASFFSYRKRASDEKMVESRDRENQGKENVVNLLGLVLSRLQWGDAYSSNGYFFNNFDEEARETKLLMKKIELLRLSPKVPHKLEQSISPENIDRFGETVWIDHLSKLRPYVRMHGINAAKAESNRLNEEREKN